MMLYAGVANPRLQKKKKTSKETQAEIRAHSPVSPVTVLSNNKQYGNSSTKKNVIQSVRLAGYGLRDRDLAPCFGERKLR